MLKNLRPEELETSTSWFEASELNARLGNGENVFDLAGADKNELTLSDLFKCYLERHAVKSRKTWLAMSKEFDRNLVSLKSRKLSMITSSVAEKLHEDLTKDRGPYSANRTIQLMRAVYNKGIQWKLFDGENPFKGITLHYERS